MSSLVLLGIPSTIPVSVKNGLIAFTNAKVFDIANTNAAALYSASSTMICRTAALAITAIAATTAMNYVQQIEGAEKFLKGDEDDFLTLEDDFATVIGRVVALAASPVTYASSIFGGKYLANRITGAGLSYRQIFLLELAHLAERFVLGI